MEMCHGPRDGNLYGGEVPVVGLAGVLVHPAPQVVVPGAEVGAIGRLHGGWSEARDHGCTN